MDIIKHLADFIMHLDKHMDVIIQSYGSWTYVLIFLIVFAETGLVVTPFLPGDSLLFVVGAFAARGSFHPGLAFALLAAAAIIGDSVNYLIGKYLGEQLSHSRFVKKEYLERTHQFYEKYGGKTIVLARFVPIVRTFAPFVAGVGKMNYRYFLTYNVVGGLLWVSLFVFGGYFFGNMPVVKKNFTMVIFAIIFLSILPGIVEFVRAKKERSVKAKAAGEPSF